MVACSCAVDSSSPFCTPAASAHVAAEGDQDAPQSSARVSCHTHMISLVFCLPLPLRLSLSSPHFYLCQSLPHRSLSCLVWAAALLANGFMPGGRGSHAGSPIASRKVSLGGSPLAAQRQTLPLPAMLGGRHGTSTAGMTLQGGGSLRGEGGEGHGAWDRRDRGHQVFSQHNDLQRLRMPSTSPIIARPSPRAPTIASLDF